VRQQLLPVPLKERLDWGKNRRLVRRGFKDLAYLPRSRRGWNGTLVALAYSARRLTARSCDLNLWATMNGCPASARYTELADNALVLWHGTSAARAAQIAKFGLFHKRGVWTALEPKIAHRFSRSRARQYGAGSATVVLLLDKRDVAEGTHYDHETPEVLRFYAALPAKSIEYLLWDDRIEFLGESKAKWPKPWGVARFKKKAGRWVPLSRSPVRFDHQQSYSSLDEWLHLSIRRILSTLGSASAIEVFSSLYSTIDPWEALEDDAVFRALERLSQLHKLRGGARQYSLASEPGE